MVNFFASSLFGIMISFMILVSPVVFKVLTKESSQAFLRTFFPRLFILGIIISGTLVALTFQELIMLPKILSIFIFLGFLLNLLVITPNVNKYRDLELQGNNRAKKIFSFLHFLSVCIFISQLILLLLIIFI
tara:strand:+ start:42640 stop:43035 length:396 start_codon:yes stop_codon:yes gene_type:complete